MLYLEQNEHPPGTLILASKVIDNHKIVVTKEKLKESFDDREISTIFRGNHPQWEIIIV